MLIQFTFENFLSFRDKIIFSLRALDDAPASSAYIETHGLKLLKCAAVYGANASGKSNLVNALKFCERLVLTGVKSSQPIPIKPFRLDPACTEAPSQFEFELLISGAIYSYGFRFNSNTVIEEWLFRTSHLGGEEELMFERHHEPTKPEQASFSFGPAIATDPNRIQFLTFVGEGTRRNQLFLSEAVERNVAELGPIFDWFRRKLWLISPKSVYGSLAKRVMDDSDFREFLETYLASADTGIAGLSATKSKINLSIRSVTERAEQEENQEENQEEIERDLLRALNQQGEQSITMEAGEFVALNLSTHRRDVSGNDVSFAIEDESDGTRRLMHLSPALHPSKTPVRTLVIDELDRSLHPLLTRKFVRDFLNGGHKPQEQLIFTTHDTNLLSRDILPAEAVWFVEKDRSGCSHLYSLAEFDPDQVKQLGDTIESGYLSGRFGAIPFFADRKKLGWE